MRYIQVLIRNIRVLYSIARGILPRYWADPASRNKVIEMAKYQRRHK